jgi:Mg-chelatase subunit ChlD
MHWYQKAKKKSAILLTGMLLMSMLPVFVGTNTVYGTEVDNGCLAISGVGNVPITSVERNQLVTINYTLDPSGTHTVTQTRDAVDIAFVADVSGSMAFHMDKDNSRTPIRLDILKSASETLTNKFKAVNMGDRLGLIKFSSDASKVYDLSTEYEKVQTEIDKLKANGSTNIDDGLAKAKTMLTASGTKPVKQIILLTDGKATVWTDENDGNKQKSGETSAANAAKADADVLAGLGIKVYTIALATAGSDEIDLELLQYIATKTGGMAYEASSASQLSAIFDNIAKTIEAPAQLKTVTLRQPIPAGFILAPNENASNVRYEAATHEVVVNVGDINFPFDQDKIDLAIKLIPDTAAGDYPLQDAKVTYKDACNANRQFNINFGTQLSVSVRVVDKYGNVYIGNSQGELQRLRASDKQKQWTINNKKVAISDIHFIDTEIHSIVRITYKDGTTDEFDLKPTAPATYELVDGNGKPINENGWHVGPGALRSVSGSSTQLPSSTVYANDDFKGAYIAGYEISLDNGNWQSQTTSGVVIPDGNGVNFKTRAFTNAISGSASIPIGGAVATGNVSLDSTGPMISWSKDIKNPTDSDADGIIYITATDNLSPVTNVKVWFDNKSLSISSSSSKMTRNGNTYAFRLSDVTGFDTVEKRQGWHQIQFEATSIGGTTSTAEAPEYFVVNPGPTATLKGMNYNDGDISDKPVSVAVVDEKYPVSDRSFGSHVEHGFTLKNMYYVIKQSSATPEASEWKPLASKRLTVTTKTNTTSGTYYVFLKLVDSSNVEMVQQPLIVKFDTEQNNN